MTDESQRGQSGVLQAQEPERSVDTKSGGRVDFDAVFKDHYGFVCRGLRSMAVAPHAVEDLAQEVFVVFHRRLPEFDRSRDVRRWLWGIARRVASTDARSRARAARRLAVVPAPLPGTALDEEVDRRRTAQVVARLLEQLPQAQREVFVLIDVESMSAPDVAAALDLKLNTVYSRLRLAREKFADAGRRYRASLARGER